MNIDIVVPMLGESVTEATILQWYKKPGDAVAIDEPLCELETDKVTVEIPAPSAGVMREIVAPETATVEVGARLGVIEAGTAQTTNSTSTTNGTQTAKNVQENVIAPAATKSQKISSTTFSSELSMKGNGLTAFSPSVRRLIDEHKIDPHTIKGTGKDGRILKSDVLAIVEQTPPHPESTPSRVETILPRPQDPREERVRMTRLRQTVARRLKQSQETAAQLTTFNEIDMSAMVAMRRKYRELFEQKHKVRLGFMSFFVKACIVALHDVPGVNAEIEGDEIIYKNYINMGVAVGIDKGLVVPVLRDAHLMSFAEIEKNIAVFAQRARDGALTLDDMQGGTFTISNGGVYGSLMSTPILNMPQSGILGMHKIEERPVVVDGAIVVRPMMYLALSYDHRMIDGREAVTFLVRIKECIESPERLLLNL